MQMSEIYHVAEPKSKKKESKKQKDRRVGDVKSTPWWGGCKTRYERMEHRPESVWNESCCQSQSGPGEKEPPKQGQNKSKEIYLLTSSQKYHRSNYHARWDFTRRMHEKVFYCFMVTPAFMAQNVLFWPQKNALVFSCLFLLFALEQHKEVSDSVRITCSFLWRQRTQKVRLEFAKVLPEDTKILLGERPDQTKIELFGWSTSFFCFQKINRGLQRNEHGPCSQTRRRFTDVLGLI